MATQDKLPTGDAGSPNNTWTALGGGSKYVEVDDPIESPDDATTEINTQGEDDQQFTFAAFAIDSSSINKITVSLRHKRDSGSYHEVKAQLVVNGVEYLGAIIATSSTIWTSTSTDWLTNPNTVLAWTEADVEGTGANPLQRFGVNDYAHPGNTVRVTQIYVTVDYEAAAGGPTVPQFMPSVWHLMGSGGMVGLMWR